MLIRDLKDCEEFVAGDNTLLREFLHSDKQDISLRYSLAHAVVKPSEVTFRHRLKTSEVYYIFEDKGRMTINDESQHVFAGQAVYIPPGALQYIENTGSDNLIFFS